MTKRHVFMLPLIIFSTSLAGLVLTLMVQGSADIITSVGVGSALIVFAIVWRKA